MSGPNPQDVTSIFGGREKIVRKVIDMISTFSVIEKWTPDMFAKKAFPATARAAEGEAASDRAISNFNCIRAMADALVNRTTHRLPDYRYVLTFLRALGVPLEIILPAEIPDKEKLMWSESLRNGHAGGHPAVGDGRNIDHFLAINALVLVCDSNGS